MKLQITKQQYLDILTAGLKSKGYGMTGIIISNAKVTAINIINEWGNERVELTLAEDDPWGDSR